MRITTLKLLLSAIAASVVTMLAAGPAAATGGSCPAPVFLHLNTPGKALSEAAPGGTGTFAELPVLRRSGGNPYLFFGEWEGSFESDADCSDAYDLQLWLGLKNSDDQGTNFDVKVELFVDGVSQGTDEFLCIKGVTRNPLSAVQISPSAFASFSKDGTVPIALKVWARIGTGTPCGGHASATGLRLYYGSQARDSRFVIGGETVAASEDCPATGCSLGPVNSADGITSVVVDVPGGGKAGLLTIVLSTPPENDGCFGDEEEPPPPIGSEVTVIPPGGYTPGNPITVDITYDIEGSVSVVCKSNNGNLPFTPLPSCTFFDEQPTPTNVPCWVSESSTEVIVFMTSQDPAVTAH